MISIYGNKRSRATRILWILEEIGTPYELKNIDFDTHQQKTPEYLALNPNGTVPTLDDNGLILFESFAINTYLADKYKPELLGMTPEIRGQVHQWSYWTANNLEANCVIIAQQKWSDAPNAAIITKATESLDRYMTILNNFLQGKNYLVNDTFTIADLNATSVVNFAKLLGYNIDQFTTVKAWFDKNQSRPAYLKAVAS
jgi:glutathione S-transferase